MEPKSLKPALAEFDRLYVEPASGLPIDQRELANIIITAICTAIDTGKVEPIDGVTSLSSADGYANVSVSAGVLRVSAKGGDGGRAFAREVVTSSSIGAGGGNYQPFNKGKA